MIQALVTALISYLGTTSDYLVVLLLVFAHYGTRANRRSVIIGAYVGNFVLVGVALMIAVVLKKVPDEWLLGLLGIIPIVMGIKAYFFGDDEESAVKARLGSFSPVQIIYNVILNTVATCGADNLALYVPYFANTDLSFLPAILILFLVVLTIVIFVAKWCAGLQVVSHVFEKYGELFQLVIYIVLGVYVMLEAGTLQHLLALI